jgi:hypothetical protein
MKRHFSNRGEAISEVTAARVLASRKASIKASFMSQGDRRTNLPFWSLQGVDVGNHPRKKQTKRSEDDTIMF